VRASADSVQYIGCQLYLSGGVVRLACNANDVNSHYLSCSTDDRELVRIGQSISDNSYLYFRCDASGRLDYLYVANASQFISR
jgi:hypothetical protein